MRIINESVKQVLIKDDIRRLEKILDAIYMWYKITICYSVKNIL